jgi:hypothetical protein
MIQPIGLEKNVLYRHQHDVMIELKEAATPYVSKRASVCFHIRGIWVTIQSITSFLFVRYGKSAIRNA